MQSLLSKNDLLNRLDCVRTHTIYYDISLTHQFTIHSHRCRTFCIIIQISVCCCFLPPSLSHTLCSNFFCSHFVSDTVVAGTATAVVMTDHLPIAPQHCYSLRLPHTWREKICQTINFGNKKPNRKPHEMRIDERKWHTRLATLLIAADTFAQKIPSLHQFQTIQSINNNLRFFSLPSRVLFPIPIHHSLSLSLTLFLVMSWVNVDRLAYMRIAHAYYLQFFSFFFLYFFFGKNRKYIVRLAGSWSFVFGRLLFLLSSCCSNWLSLFVHEKPQTQQSTKRCPFVHGQKNRSIGSTQGNKNY